MSSPKLRVIFRPKSEIQTFIPPKIWWSPKKKKKKKRSSPKLRLIFRPKSLGLGWWGECIPPLNPPLVLALSALPLVSALDHFCLLWVKLFIFYQWRNLGRQPAPPQSHHFGWHDIMMWNHNSTNLWWIPYFYHFVWSPPSSFGLKTHWFLGEDLFFLGLHILLDRKPTYFGPFFFFGLHLFLVQKRVPPRNPVQGATIFSNVSVPVFYCR